MGKPGVIYLSSVPEGMNVTQTTAFFSEFGRVGRVFLQPDKTDKQKGKYNRVFSEGWVEFMSKKVARVAAERLNCQPVGGKRKSKAYEEIWNIKYLPRFKWVHLSERLAYEAAVRQQRMRTEISQVKREAEHFKNSVEKKRKKSKKIKDTEEAELPSVPFQFRQRETEKEIKKRKREESILNESGDASPMKKKKTKKSKEKSEELPKVDVKTKCKKGKKRDEKSKGKNTSENDRSDFLKSVFGGGT